MQAEQRLERFKFQKMIEDKYGIQSGKMGTMGKNHMKKNSMKHM
jgi:hypothetical protein